MKKDQEKVTLHTPVQRKKFKKWKKKIGEKMKQIGMAVLLLALFALPLMAADDGSAALARETNERTLAIARSTDAIDNKIADLSVRVSQAQYAAESLKSNTMFAMLLQAVFSAFLTAYIAHRYVARPIVESLQTWQTAPAPAAALAPTQAPVAAKQEEYEIVEAWVCPEDGADQPRHVKFCPEHGKKIVLHKTRMLKLPPALPTVAQNVEKRAKKPFWAKLL